MFRCVLNTYYANTKAILGYVHFCLNFYCYIIINEKQTFSLGTCVTGFEQGKVNCMQQENFTERFLCTNCEIGELQFSFKSALCYQTQLRPIWSDAKYITLQDR